MNGATTESRPTGECRLCGCVLDAGDAVVRVSGELFHAPCAEPALQGTTAWREREVGTLNQLVVGVGRATVV